MNKAEIIAKIAEDSGISKAQATVALNSFLSAVAKTLKNGGKVRLLGLGTFSVSKRAARVGRNPQTGSAIKIQKKTVAKFKPGNVFQARIGGGTDDTGPMRTKK